MNINLLIEKISSNDQLFDDGKINDNAKYLPFKKGRNLIKNIKFKPSKTLKLKLSRLLKINPTNIQGTTISIDANKEEKDADEYLKKQGLLL